MNDPWASGVRPSSVLTRRLDQRSRRAMAAFLLRLCGVSAIVAWSCLANARPVPDSIGTLSGLYTIAAAAGLAWAMLGREAFGRGSLNRWDEALAFAALSRLAHLVLQIVHGFHI